MQNEKIIIPPHLKPGDVVGISATARKISPAEIKAAIDFIESAGYKTKLAPDLFAKDRQFAGTDQTRANGINTLIADKSVRAILCARGGYGSVRLLEKIDWQTLKINPKWISGFSDVTAIHNHLQQQLGMASLHSTMMVGFEKNTPMTNQSFINAWAGNANQYSFEKHPLNRNGNATGAIVGGNLSVLYSMLGSPSQLDTKGKILFIEDLDEYLYHIDRMMMALKRAGQLSQLKALVVGGMSDMNDNAIPFGKTAEEIIADVVSEFDYPLLFNFPAGHLPNNCAIKFGVEASFVCEEKITFLQK